MRLPDNEVRRLVAHLTSRISTEELAEVEDFLRSEEGTDALRRRAMIRHFPRIEVALSVAGVRWLVRVTSHAHLRLVQRGITIVEAQNILTDFVSLYARIGELIVQGNYALVGRTHRGVTTVQIEIERVTDTEGEANIVTVYLGRPREDENPTIVEWM